MEDLHTILLVCAFLAGIFLLPIIFLMLKTIIIIVSKKLKKQKISQDIYKNLNPYFIFNEFKGKDNKINLGYIIVLIIFTVGLFGLAFEVISYTQYGSEEIGSFMEKKEYTAYYYVNMYPGRSTSKNYKVKAKIHSVKNSDRGGERRYHIQEAYFDNGKTITFFNDGDFETLKLNKLVSIDDDNKITWNIELTDIKVE
jgi:hypothetical protein